MEEKKTPETGPDELCYRRTIGKTTYLVHVHFSKTSTETMEDKIKRMLVNEIKRLK